MTGEDKEPFLLTVFVVIGTDCLARRDLIHAGAGALRPELLAEPQHASAKPFRIVCVIGEVRLGDV